MKLSKLLENIQKMIKENPEYANLPVVFGAQDDKCFKVERKPDVGFYQGDCDQFLSESEFEGWGEVNAFIIN